MDNEIERYNLHRNSSATSNHLMVPRDVTVFHQPGTGLAAATIAHNFLNRAPSKRTRPMLRSTANQTATLTRARSRTLRLTLLILITFIFCWTPYVVMTLWYVLDRDQASLVNETLQEALFLMAVTGSVINPVIYGTVGRKQNCKKRFNFLLNSSSRTHSIIKWVCCCSPFCCKLCCEQLEHGNSETVVITLNRLNGSGRSGRNSKNNDFNSSHHNRHRRPSQSSCSPHKDLSPLSPLQSLPRSQIVTLRAGNNNSPGTLKLVKSFVPANFIPKDGGNNGELLVKEKEECFECGIPITVQYIVPIKESPSQESTHV